MAALQSDEIVGGFGAFSEIKAIPGRAILERGNLKASRVLDKHYEIAIHEFARLRFPLREIRISDERQCIERQIVDVAVESCRDEDLAAGCAIGAHRRHDARIEGNRAAIYVGPIDKDFKKGRADTRE